MVGKVKRPERQSNWHKFRIMWVLNYARRPEDT